MISKNKNCKYEIDRKKCLFFIYNTPVTDHMLLVFNIHVRTLSHSCSSLWVFLHLRKHIGALWIDMFQSIRNEG